jgi:hypothetical protein
MDEFEGIAKHCPVIGKNRTRASLDIRDVRHDGHLLVIPRPKRGASVFTFVLAVVCCAADALVIILAHGPGGSGITGEHINWVIGFSLFCALFLAAATVAAFGHQAILWDQSGLRIQNRCLLFRLSGRNVRWDEIQDIGHFCLYRTQGRILALPRARTWGTAESGELMELLGEYWRQGHPTGSPQAPAVVTVPQVDEGGKFTTLAVFGLWFLGGAAVCIIGMGYSGAWDGWGIVLGLLQAGHGPEWQKLVFPPLLAAGGMLVPFMLASLVLNEPGRHDPRAIIFDNRIGRMIVTLHQRFAPEDPARSAAVPGYAYEAIADFGFHSQIVLSSGHDATGSQVTRRRIKFMVHARLANGTSWLLDDSALDKGEAIAKVAELRRTIRLRDARCPAGLLRKPELPPSILHSREGPRECFAWRQPGSLVVPAGFIIFAFLLAWLAILLRGNDFLPGFLFLGIFSLVVLAIGIKTLVDGVRATRQAAAAVLDGTSFRVGRIPMAAYRARADAAFVLAAFSERASWPITTVRGFSTVYTEDTYRKKVRYIKVQTASGETREEGPLLSLRGISLGEAVEFEQYIGNALSALKTGDGASGR